MRQRLGKFLRGKKALWTARIALACSVLFLIAMGIEHHVQDRFNSRILHSDNVPACRVAIVFGARVSQDGWVSSVLRMRLQTALELYQTGKVEKILVSGDNRRAHYNEPEVMRDWLIKHGVPADDVGCDYAGFRTLDTCARAHRLWGLQSAILVTQRYHLPRALYLAEAHGMNAYGVSCDGNGYFYGYRQHGREYLARILAWVDVNILEREPHFWGPPESI